MYLWARLIAHVDLPVGRAVAGLNALYRVRRNERDVCGMPPPHSLLSTTTAPAWPCSNASRLSPASPSNLKSSKWRRPTRRPQNFPTRRPMPSVSPVRRSKARREERSGARGNSSRPVREFNTLRRTELPDPGLDFSIVGFRRCFGIVSGLRLSCDTRSRGNDVRRNRVNHERSAYRAH